MSDAPDLTPRCCVICGEALPAAPALAKPAVIASSTNSAAPPPGTPDAPDGMPPLAADRAGIDRAITMCAAAGEHRFIPLWRAVRDHCAGFLHIAEARPVRDIPARLRARPIICIVSDDYPATNVGPAIFDSQALRWLLGHAGVVVVTSAVPPTEWYELAAVAAAAGRCAVIIDITKHHERRWIEYARSLAPPDCRPLICADRLGEFGGIGTPWERPRNTIQ
jgi:hypothetical protein